MIELSVNCPSYIEQEMRELALSVGVSVDMLAAYFFSREVVYTR